MTLLYLLFKATRPSSGHLRATKTRDQPTAAGESPHLGTRTGELPVSAAPDRSLTVKHPPEPGDSDSSPAVPQPLTAGRDPAATQTRRRRPAAVCARPRHAAAPRTDWPGPHAAGHAAAAPSPMGAQRGAACAPEWLVRKCSNSIGGGGAGARRPRGRCPELGGAVPAVGRGGKGLRVGKGMKAAVVGCNGGVISLSKPTLLTPKRASVLRKGTATRGPGRHPFTGKDQRKDP